MQHFDGTLEEAEPEDWLALRAELAEPPDDWSGSVDMDNESLQDVGHPLLRDWQSEMELVDENRSRITESSRVTEFE
jgi:hypothetical protein